MLAVADSTDHDEALRQVQEEYFDALDSALSTLKGTLPPSVLSLSLRQFLLAYPTGSAISAEQPAQTTEPESSARKRPKRSTMVSGHARSIPATPKFHPDLPETPAALRKAAKLRSETGQSSIRVTRSTIRNQAASESASRNAPVAKPAGLEQANSTAGVISFELPNGQCVDLDMNADPQSALHQIRSQGVSVSDVRAKVNAYVAQVRSFFKSLSGHSRSK